MNYLLASLLILLSLSGCRSKPKPESQESWPSQMQKMAKDVKELLPYLYDHDAFSKLDNRKIVGERLKDFSENAHKISPKMGEKILGEDPMVKYSLDNLGSDLRRSYRAYEAERFDYSRLMARSALNNCFRCHSVAEPGGTAQWDLTGIEEFKLGAVEKADLLVATRKYDLALQHMERLIESEEFLKDKPFDYESILRRYLALILRVETDPQRALVVLKKVSTGKKLPRYIGEQIEGWKKSLKNWVAEIKTNKKQAQPLERAKLHVRRAKQIQQYPQDHAGDVEYLRVTRVLHDYLKSPTTPLNQANALMLLGQAYEVLDELGSWNLHESYYEECIRRAPKSKFAKSCFDRLEASLLQGYSGSSGIHVPASERERLKILKQLM